MARQTARLLAGLLVLAASCSSGAEDRQPILVMAAASLSDAFADVEVAFEEANPDIDVQLNLAGSASLREQILQGAPADVFASANQETMQVIVDAELAAPSTDFATNELVIAVPLGNRAQVQGLSALADADLLVGLCATGVPCGDFARLALDQAGVEASVDTEEGDVRALVTKIAADELDAGIVYATDVEANAEVTGITMPGSVDVHVSYPIAVLTESSSAEISELFVDFVTGQDGQDILRSHGFGAP